jgi:GT2 family glycosyltransferase
VRTAVVVPNWNGRRWLPGLLASLDAQTRAPDEVLVVDNGSEDGSVAWLRERGGVGVLELGRNTGFAFAANRGVEAVGGEAVALVNTDVELAPDWLARAAGRLEGDAGLAAVATKMVLLDDPATVDDAGDVLRRDGVAEQRGHGRPDGPRFDTPGEVFAACAGAAVYRREAMLAAGGFDERLFAYLEDVDLGLRLRLAGWRCAYEPAVARHARHGSAAGAAPSIDALVARNTLLLVAKAFPARWLGLVAYRQVAWAWHAARERRLRRHLGGVGAALPRLPAMLRERRELRRSAVVPIAQAVPARPWRGPAAGGHPESPQ